MNVMIRIPGEFDIVIYSGRNEMNQICNEKTTKEKRDNKQKSIDDIDLFLHCFITFFSSLVLEMSSLMIFHAF